MIFTGQTRLAKTILNDQTHNIKNQEKAIASLHMMKELVPVGVEYFKSKDFMNFGKVLNESWELKKGLATDISNFEIDHQIQSLLQKGAWGGKLLGAGSGGFILMVASPDFWEKTQKQLSQQNIFDLEIDDHGAAIIKF